MVKGSSGSRLVNASVLFADRCLVSSLGLSKVRKSTLPLKSDVRVSVKMCFLFFSRPGKLRGENEIRHSEYVLGTRLRYSNHRILFLYSFSYFFLVLKFGITWVVIMHDITGFQNRILSRCFTIFRRFLCSQVGWGVDWWSVWLLGVRRAAVRGCGDPCVVESYVDAICWRKGGLTKASGFTLGGSHAVISDQNTTFWMNFGTHFLDVKLCHRNQPSVV